MTWGPDPKAPGSGAPRYQKPPQKSQTRAPEPCPPPRPSEAPPGKPRPTLPGDQRPVLVCEFDVPANRVVLDVQAHDDDVNSVAYLDDSENVVLSGSDDAAIKLWDKRLLGTSGSPGEGEAKPAGVFYVSRSPSEGLWACVGDTD